MAIVRLDPQAQARGLLDFLQREAVNQAKAHFGDMVAYMDKVIGKLIATVDELGLEERTMIIFTGDNGTPHGIFSELGGRELEGGSQC